MKILALDSSSSVASVALIQIQSDCAHPAAEQILYRHHQSHERNNSSSFFQGVETAIKNYGKPDRIVVGLGPGSYNGLRSSIAAAQGVASACGLDLVGIPSALAFEEKNYWIAGDARGGQYWLALVSDHHFIQEPFLLVPEAIPATLELNSHLPLFAYGDLPQLPSSQKVILKTPDAVVLARLGKDAAATKRLARIFHTHRDEEVAKSDEARGTMDFDAGLYVSYRPNQNSSPTQHSSGFPASTVDGYEISGLEPLYLKSAHVTLRITSS